jgi:hypothetical protein
VLNPEWIGKVPKIQSRNGRFYNDNSKKIPNIQEQVNVEKNWFHIKL